MVVNKDIKVFVSYFLIFWAGPGSGGGGGGGTIREVTRRGLDVRSTSIGERLFLSSSIICTRT